MKRHQTTLLKQYVLGRVTHTSDQREAPLDEFERSGMKGLPFARMVGVSYQTFASWIQKRRRARGDYTGSTATPAARKRAPAPLRLVEVVVPAVQCLPTAAIHSGTPALELLLPGGRTSAAAGLSPGRARRSSAAQPQHTRRIHQLFVDQLKLHDGDIAALIAGSQVISN